MKRKVIGGLVVGFIVLLALSIVSFFVGFGAFKYIMYPLLVLNLIALIYIILKRFIGERKLIIFLVPLTIILIILVIMVLIQLPLFTDFDKDLVLAMDFDHIEGDKWSLKIDLKGENTILGMRRFSLQAPERRNYLNEFFYLSALKKEDVLSLRYEFVEVFINGEKKAGFLTSS